MNEQPDPDPAAGVLPAEPLAEVRVRTESCSAEHVRVKADEHGVALVIEDVEDGDARTFLSWQAWEQILRVRPALAAGAGDPLSDEQTFAQDFQDAELIATIRDMRAEAAREESWSRLREKLERYADQLDAALGRSPARPTEQEPYELDRHAQDTPRLLRQIAQVIGARDLFYDEGDSGWTQAFTAAERRRIARTLNELASPAARLRGGIPQDDDFAVTTYTPMLWAAMSDDQRYEEYIRVRRIAHKSQSSALSASGAADAESEQLTLETAEHVVRVLAELGLTSSTTIQASQRRLHVDAADAMRLLSIREGVSSIVRGLRLQAAPASPAGSADPGSPETGR